MSIEKAYIFARSLEKVPWVGVASPKQFKRFRMLVRKQERPTKRPRESEFFLLDFLIHIVLINVISKKRGGGKWQDNVVSSLLSLKKH